MGFSHISFAIIKLVQTSLIPQADSYFIDASSNGIGGIHGPDIYQPINASFSSLQQDNGLF